MRHPLSERYHAFLKELGKLHDRKQEDYGSDTDPFANVRASEKWGVPAWVGALMRADDKMARLRNFARKRQLANESAQDSMRDIAVYMGIALVLYEEETKQRPQTLQEAVNQALSEAGIHYEQEPADLPFVGEPHGDVQLHEHPRWFDNIQWHYHERVSGNPVWRDDQLVGPEPAPDIAGKDITPLPDPSAPYADGDGLEPRTDVRSHADEDNAIHDEWMNGRHTSQAADAKGRVRSTTVEGTHYHPKQGGILWNGARVVKR